VKNTGIRSYFEQETEGNSGQAGLSNAEVSDRFLESHATLFQLAGIDLQLSEEREGSSQTTCKYEQYHNEVPVYGAHFNVSMRHSDRQVMSAINKIQWGIPKELGVGSVKISSDGALDFVRESLNKQADELICSEPQMFVYHHQGNSDKGSSIRTDPDFARLSDLFDGVPGKFYLVWSIKVDTHNPKKYWEFLIHASKPGLLTILDRRRYLGGRTAKVFWPDPVTSSGNPKLHRASPQHLLDAEQVEVVLENLDDSAQSSGFLTGKWVRIAELEAPLVSLTPGKSDCNFSSTDPEFLSVMAYYYIDRLVEWLVSLGVPVFSEAIKAGIDVDAHGADGADNSHFVVPVIGPAYISFGEGGTPDASDPGVIVHEFGHAMHYFLIGHMPEPAGCEEGFNDFLSCVFRDRFNKRGFDRANPFPWDNNLTDGWDARRRCDVDYRYNDSYYRRSGLYRKGSWYASVLWDLYLQMGGASEDPLIRIKAAGDLVTTYCDMLISVGDNGPLQDLVNGLISCDISRSGGTNTKIIKESFNLRGLKLK
jgi:zinc metalloprotease ZmpB